MVIDKLRPGAWTGDLARMASDELRKAGCRHRSGWCCSPTVWDMCRSRCRSPTRRTDVPDEKGFLVEENMVLSVDCLYFGGSLGPCHMENVFIIRKDRAESLYSVPLEILGPR